MWPVLVNLWGIKITWFGISLAVGYLWASFVLWRAMRVDYEQEEILSLTVWLAVLAWLGSGIWAWWWDIKTVGGGLVGMMVGLLWWCRGKKKWDFWEWLDNVAWVSLGVGALGSLGWGPDGVISGGMLVVGLGVGKWVWNNYRKFRWYTSGKPGFSGIFALGWWGIVIAIGRPDGVYWAPWVVIAAMVAIYLRGDRRATSDLKLIWQKIKRNKR